MFICYCMYFFKLNAIIFATSKKKRHISIAIEKGNKFLVKLLLNYLFKLLKGDNIRHSVILSLLWKMRKKHITNM